MAAKITVIPKSKFRDCNKHMAIDRSHHCKNRNKIIGIISGIDFSSISMVAATNEMESTLQRSVTTDQHDSFSGLAVKICWENLRNLYIG